MQEKEKQPQETPPPAGGGLGSPFDQATAPGAVTVSVGPYVQSLPVAGKTVGEVRKRFKSRMDIDDRSQAIVDGTEVDADTVLSVGQTLMFIHKSGEKGMNDDIKQFELMLADPAIPVKTKVDLLKGVLADGSAASKKAIEQLLKTLQTKNAGAVDAKKTEMLNALLAAMMEGPYRIGSFIEMLTGTAQARVMLGDGTAAYTAVPKLEMVETLKCGDEVLLDKTAAAIIQHVGLRPDTGEEALFERTLDGHIEVTLRGDRQVYTPAYALANQIKDESVKPGATLIVNEKQKIAYRAIPAADSLAHYRYLERCPVPDVRVERDIGNPPVCIGECIDHIRVELTDGEMARKYGVRRSQMRLMAGVSGTGKTLAIQAICAGAYELMSEITDTPVAQLPPRTFRLRMSEVLNFYLGESDKNLARFFKEVEQLADEPFVNERGRQFLLPVIAIIEEVDGLARARGQERDGIYDRILTTALQWLDATRPELNRKLILYLGTTNEPGAVDRAFLRRIGGSMDTFGRLNRDGLSSVLGKHLGKVPVAGDKRETVSDIVEWIFEDASGIELTFGGGRTAQRHRRDMLTGALVDRAVQDAAKLGLREQLKAKAKTAIGISLGQLKAGFDSQCDAMLSQVNEHNAHHYVDIPDGARVASLRRITQTQPVATPRKDS